MLSFINRAKANGIRDDLQQYSSETASVDQMAFCVAWLLEASISFRGLFEPRIWWT